MASVQQMALDPNQPGMMGGPMPVPDVVGSALAPQLGSDQNYLSRGMVDMRRFSVIKEEFLGFLLYAKIRSRKSRVWVDIYDELLNLYVSVGGRGRRDIIRMESVSRGGQAQVEAEILRPGIIARNIYDRDWKKRQLEEKGL